MRVEPEISAIVPTHNPDEGRLRRTLVALRDQNIPVARFEVIIVDNASTRFPEPAFFAELSLPNLVRIEEPHLGLTAARSRGFSRARGELAVLVDDDNVLAPDYLAVVASLFTTHPRVGVLGGRSIPEFAEPPPDWATPFFPLLALRDPGTVPLFAETLRPAGSARNVYPPFAPIGAGMGLRRAAWQAWLQAHADGERLSDRCGGAFTSSGDNDIVFCAMKAGWSAAYFPQLSLTHLIPAARLKAAYLARLNRGIQQSWMQVLRLHDASPWPPLSPTGAVLRKAKAWFTHHAWQSAAARVRWQGACGHFDGRVTPRP
jgi:glycosyltransferase involved in cell wall biosynthesis